MEDLRDPKVRERFTKELAVEKLEDEVERQRRIREFKPQMKPIALAVKNAL